MKLQYDYDLIYGNWTTLILTNLKRNDQLNSKETVGLIPKSDLYIGDLGYITPIYLKAVIKEEASFLNRLPPQISVYGLDKEPIEKGC